MKLKKFTVNSGGKFDGANGPFVIDFTKSKMVGLMGDQETGKSTMEEMILLNAAAIGGKGITEIVEALKNKKTGVLDTELEFVGNDRADYHVRNKNGVLTVKREGDRTEGGAKELLRKVFGVTGMSPMAVKNGDIDDIIDFLASYSTRGVDEFKKDMLANKKGQEQYKKARASANKSAKGIREYLIGEGIMNDKGEIIEKVWKENESKYKTKIDVKKLSTAFEEANKAYNLYQSGNEKLTRLRNDKKSIENQIAALQKQLAIVEADIVKGEKFMTENKKAKEVYDAAKLAYDNAAKEVVAYDKWKDIKTKKAELDEFEDLATKADSKEKDLIKKQQELQWEVIPDIRGVEIVLEDTHEDEGVQKKAGFYYKGLNSRQLSASEWFGLVMQILKKNKVQFLVVDDISQFGSKFMETLNGLVESGCTVLYSEMDRTIDELTVVYNPKVA